MEILLILLLLAAPSAPSLAPLLSALAAIPQAAQGSQCPAPQAQNAAMQPPQNSAAPSPQGEEGQLLASLLQLFRSQEGNGEGGAPQDAPGLFAQLLQLFSAPREKGEKNAPQEAALAALLRQLTENAESTQGNACAKRPQGAAEQAVQAYKMMRKARSYLRMPPSRPTAAGLRKARLAKLRIPLRPSAPSPPPPSSAASPKRCKAKDKG